MRNIININNTVAVRCYSSGPTSAGNGAETQTARKNEYTDNSSENGIEDALVDEGPNVERLRSDIDLKDKEIIELKVRSCEVFWPQEEGWSLVLQDLVDITQSKEPCRLI